jgi:hypothetical protein
VKLVTQNTNRHTVLENGGSLSNRCALAEWLVLWRKRFGYISVFAALPTVLTAQTPETRPQGEQRQPERGIGGRTARFADKVDKGGGNLDFLTPQSDYRPPHPNSNFDITTVLNGNDDCPGTAIPPGAYTAASPFVDAGDTTGANDTVTNVIPYYSYSSNGPDRIYTFVVTSIGPNPEIKVTTTSPTYRPMIYVTDHPCPAGTGATISDWSPGRRIYSTKVSDSRWGNGNTAVVGGYVSWTNWDALYFGKRMYLFERGWGIHTYDQGYANQRHAIG